MNTSFTELSAALMKGSASDIGKRQNQEDRYALAEYQTADGRPALLAMVADGIGGHNSGEIASNMAQKMIPELLLGNPPSASETTRRLKAALEETGQQIFDESLKDPDRSGMGTTCTAIAVIDRRLYLAHVGDSRAYLLRGGQLHQLTVDHTWAEEAIRAGRSPDEIRSHPNRGVIMRYLGIDPNIAIDTRYRTLTGELVDGSTAGPLFLEPGDTLLLSTDGVSDTLDPRFLAEFMAYPDCQNAAETLVTSATKAGATDNVTAVVLRLPGGAVVGPKGAAGAGAAGGGAKRSMLPAILAVVGGLVVIAVAAVLLLNRPPAATPQPAVSATTVEAPALGEPTATRPRATSASTTGGGLVVEAGAPTMAVDTPAPTLPADTAAISGTGAISSTAPITETTGGEPTVAPTFTPDLPPTPRPTPRPDRTQPVAAASPTRSSGGAPATTSSGGVSLLVPANGEKLNGTGSFEWRNQPNFSLAGNEYYELIIWGLNENPDAGRSPIGASKAQLAKVDLTALEAVLKLEDGQTYNWGVRLRQGTPPNDRPVRMLSDSREFTYARAGGPAAPPIEGENK